MKVRIMVSASSPKPIDTTDNSRFNPGIVTWPIVCHRICETTVYSKEPDSFNTSIAVFQTMTEAGGSAVFSVF
jgi:hypothetical protein